MTSTIDKPTFCAKEEYSHIFHQSHHQHAVRVICEDRLTRDALTFANGRDSDNGWFPFTQHPKGANPINHVAEFPRTTGDTRLIHHELLAYIPALPDGVVGAQDYEQQALCCVDCNRVMTMEFWFRYHLYGTNGNRLIPVDDVQVKSINANGHLLSGWKHWTHPVSGPWRFPHLIYEQKDDMMSAMVGYYLHLCIPPTVQKTPKYKLYVAMSWVILEVTCLICELVKGSCDAEDRRVRIKRNKPKKNVLGCIELYLSYMAWRLLGFREKKVRDISFNRWHTFYFGEAIHCPEIFPRDQARTLIADYITPNNMDMPSRELILKVGRRMVKVIEQRLSLLVPVVCNRADPDVDCYFLPVRNLNEICALLDNGAKNDFDSYLRLVGIEPLWFRVLDLSRDFDEAILKRLKAFRAAWRRYEIQNIARHLGDKTTRRAAIEYGLCRLLYPPTQAHVDGMSAAQLADTLTERECGRWTSALALRGLRAFDFDEEDEA